MTYPNAVLLGVAFAAGFTIGAAVIGLLVDRRK